LILMIGVATASFEVLAPIADSMSNQLESYTKFATGFVTMWGGGTVGVDFWNPFHFSPEDIPGSTFNITKSLPFDEKDIANMSSMEGVETVYRTAIMAAAYTPTKEQREKMHERFPDIERREDATGTWDTCLVCVEAEAALAGLLPYANVEKGRFLRPGETDAVVVSTILEKEWGFTVGDEIPLIIWNDEHRFKIVGVYSGLLPTAMDFGFTAVMELDELFTFLDVDPSDGRFNALFIKVGEPSLAQPIVKALREEYPTAQVHYEFAFIETSMELLSSTLNTYDLIRNLLLLVSAATIILIRLIDLLRHRRELGLYMGIGWRERDILSYMLWQSAIIGLIGATVGILLTVATGGYLSEALVPERLKYMFSISTQVPDPAFLPLAPLIALVLSTLTFAAGYLYIRRLTPLKALEEV